MASAYFPQNLYEIAHMFCGEDMELMMNPNYIWKENEKF